MVLYCLGIVSLSQWYLAFHIRTLWDQNGKQKNWVIVRNGGVGVVISPTGLKMQQHLAPKLKMQQNLYTSASDQYSMGEYIQLALGSCFVGLNATVILEGSHSAVLSKQSRLVHSIIRWQYYSFSCHWLPRHSIVLKATESAMYPTRQPLQLANVQSLPHCTRPTN